MRLLFVAVALLTLGCAEWTPRDRDAFAVSVWCHAIDAYQTRWAMRHNYVELNPLLGDHASDEEIVGLKVATLGAQYAIAERLGDETPRWVIVTAMTIPCVWAVWHNYEEGVRP